MAVSDVTDADFDQVVVKSTKPVIVDYWASWCSPCKQLSPIVDELSNQFGDRVSFVKLDTEANTKIPLREGIMALPTLQFWFNGQVVKSLQGAKTKGALTKAIEELL